MRFPGRSLIQGMPLIIALAVLNLPTVGWAQSQGKVWRVGFLNEGSKSAGSVSRSVEAFLGGLRDLGYVEGKNLQIEWRFADGKRERLPALAAELFAAHLDVLVAAPNGPIRAAQAATSTVPIVMAAVNDPVGAGLVSRLSHPGGNMTGLTNMAAETSGKLIQILHEAIPKAKRVAILFYGTTPTEGTILEKSRTAAKPTGMQLIPIHLMKAEDLQKTLQAVVRERADALVISADAVLLSMVPQINSFALDNRLPTMYPGSVQVEQGGLMSFGTNYPDLYRRAATFVDKIFKGAKPADLPVEEPTKFEFLINMKTAKALGLKIPDVSRLRADRIIE